MRKRRLSAVILGITLPLMILTSLPSDRLAWAADPDFTDVTDILGGQRHLLRDDDLIVFHNFCGTFCSPSSFVLQTSDSTVTQAVRADAPWEPPEADTFPGLNTALAVGRMFNLPNDVVAAVGTQDNNGTLLVSYYIYDPVHGINLSGAVPTGLPYGDVDFAGMADFTGDGYADLLVHNLSGGLRIASAKDVTDMSAGLTWGSEVQAITTPDCPNINTICYGFAVGDFQGNVQYKIAMVGVGGDDSGLALNLYNVDPTTLTITQLGSTTLPIPDASALFLSPYLAAGRFGTTLHDQLVLLYGSGGGTSVNDKVVTIDFDAALQPTVKATLDLGTMLGGSLSGARALRSGRLNWFGQFEQAVVMAASGDFGEHPDTATIRVLTFDENLNIANPGRLDPTDLACIADLAVGNFDHMQTNPNPPPAIQRDPNLQLAILWQPQCGRQLTSRFAVSLYNVDTQQNFQPSFGSTFTYQQELGQAAFIGPHLVAGDAQGRSLLLGAPQKVTIIGHIQPDIVLGIPPMHIDYIRDVNNLGPNGTPSVLNISVMPSLPAPATAFNTQYSFSSSASTAASRKNTTSYAFSTKETAEAKVSYGIPDIASVSVDLKTAAQQTHDTTVVTAFNTYSGVTNNLSATTGFADHLFFTETRFNIYYDPVIGQTVCPAASPACADSEKLPLHVQFSGPDMVTHSDIDATTQEWYQPPWEPGNLFSYPWNLPLLQQAFPELSPLTTSPAPWRGTDTSTSLYTTTWAEGSGSSQSSGSVNSNSIDVSVTVAAQASIEGFGISGSAGFEVNSSESVSTLNTSTQTLSASTGIQVNKPDFGDVVADNYLYDFGGYVFGKSPATGTVQTIPLEDAQGNPIAIQATGPLTVGFVADPLREGLPWWLQAYIRPDVGLSHPERWNWSKSTQTASFNSANSEEPALDQPFYHIKGLFITPQDADGTGPQLTTATAGDQLRLQARVYNYSLVDMPAGTQVHGRFYGQVYDNGNLNRST